jgi:hypothetical protein
MLGPVNAFEAAQPDLFAKAVVALVDIGFKSSTISILFNGELVLNRVVGIGGDRLTSGLADSMSISYAEAEGIKIGMPEEVQAMMHPLLSPLGRELRASIDFFEHQHDKAVGSRFCVRWLRAFGFCPAKLADGVDGFVQKLESCEFFGTRLASEADERS